MTSATAPDGTLLVHANYLLRFQGSRPETAEVEALGKTLPNVVTSSLPPLYSYLPKKGRIPNSERYLLGSQSLSRFESRIGASLAALDRGAEGALAKYRFGQREMQLTIFGYPTPQMAIERFRYFRAHSQHCREKVRYSDRCSAGRKRSSRRRRPAGSGQLRPGICLERICTQSDNTRCCEDDFGNLCAGGGTHCRIADPRIILRRR